MWNLFLDLYLKYLFRVRVNVYVCGNKHGLISYDAWSVCASSRHITRCNNTKVPPYRRICILWNFNYGVRAYQTIIVGRATVRRPLLGASSFHLRFAGPYRAPKVVPRARTWGECRSSFERGRASHVIFIEWVDTHYFALQSPYERYDRAGRADRTERSRINNARTRARFLGLTYVQFCANPRRTTIDGTFRFSSFSLHTQKISIHTRFGRSFWHLTLNTC